MAKIMFASLAWYHLSVMPLPLGWLDRVNKAIHQFVWQGFTKVSITQCMFSKSELGLGLWDMKSKSEGLRSKWIVSHL